MQHAIFSASEDGCVKIWDRRNGLLVNNLNFREGNAPFYSVATNKNIICAGSDKEIVFWDLRNLKKSLMFYKNAHTLDVTGLQYHKENPNWLLSCSTDSQLCHFDFNEKPTLTEMDTMEGVYCSN
jgi:WD40 repeat protein